MAQPQPKFNEVKCSVDFFNKLVQYIQAQPYVQVAGLIEEIKVSFVPVLLPIAKEAKPEERPLEEKDVTADPHAEVVEGSEEAA